MHTIFRIDGTITETPHAPILRELKDTKTKESAYFVALPATDSSSVLTRVTPIERLPNQWAEYGIESHPPRRGDPVIYSDGTRTAIISPDYLESLVRKHVYLVTLPTGLEWVRSRSGLPIWCPAEPWS